MNHTDQFITRIQESISDKQLINLQLANKRNLESDLKSVHVKPVLLKKGERLCFVYRHQTKDITKNYVLDDGITILAELLTNDFYQASLYTAQADVFLNLKKDGSGSIKVKELDENRSVNLEHDHKKHRIISPSRPFLHALGITGHDGKIKKDKQAKYRQINKYIELLQDSMKTIKLEEPYRIADMGSGKGYLTFALYDYLSNKLGHEVRATGVEMRNDLVKLCNQIAKSCEYDGLNFSEGTIQENKVKKMDIMVALHACDTATDDAIAKGIQSDASMIVCSPCCHKQIRKQMNPSNSLGNITQFGILKERQSELITDTIRAMILQAHGYTTKVIEFINTEHTPKNLLIIATKKKDSKLDQSILEQVAELKQLHGIDFHYLEKALGL